MNEFDPFVTGQPLFIIQKPNFIKEIEENIQSSNKSSFVRERHRYARSIQTETNAYVDALQYFKGERGDATKNRP